jgi:ribulose-5-phosphate 4-epimerase/fuculose-1-phosphate aldolase
MTATPIKLETGPDPVREARVDLAASYRLAARYGYDDGIWNHFTLTVPDAPDHFLVKAHGLLMSEVTASNLIVVDAEGTLIEGDGYVERTALCIHSKIHQLIAEANCVIHAHPPHCSWLADIENGRVEMIDQDSMGFLGRVAYDDDYQGIAPDIAEGERMARAFDGKPILLSRNHGVTTIGPTVADAFHDLHYMERICAKQYRVAVSGKTPSIIPQEVLDRTHNHDVGGYRAEAAKLLFDALKRQLDREQPDYRD